MRWTWALILVGLTSCAGQPVLPPSSAPTVEQIATKGAEYQTVSSMPPLTYLNIGTGLARERCLSYFDQLVQAQDRRNFASGEGNLLAGIGTGAASALGAAPGPLAAIGLASAFFQGTLANAATNSGAGAFPEETAGLILDRSMTTYLAALPVPTTIAEADLYLQGLAAECSSTKIHQYMRDALRTAQLGVVNVAPAVPATEPVPAPKPRRHPLPPPPPRDYPPSLLQQQWNDVQRYGRNYVESGGKVIVPPVVGVIQNQGR